MGGEKRPVEFVVSGGTVNVRESQMDAHEELIDCDAGRRLGCATFCCRLLVRVQPGDDVPGHAGRSCVDKDPATGRCVFQDPHDSRCTIWPRRPRVCAAYECNSDPLLQVVLRDGFVSLTRLVKAPPPSQHHPWLRVPTMAHEDAE